MYRRKKKKEDVFRSENVITQRNGRNKNEEKFFFPVFFSLSLSPCFLLNYSNNGTWCNLVTCCLSLYFADISRWRPKESSFDIYLMTDSMPMGKFCFSIFFPYILSVMLLSSLIVQRNILAYLYAYTHLFKKEYMLV